MKTRGIEEIDKEIAALQREREKAVEEAKKEWRRDSLEALGPGWECSPSTGAFTHKGIGRDVHVTGGPGHWNISVLELYGSTSFSGEVKSKILWLAQLALENAEEEVKRAQDLRVSVELAIESE